MLNLNKSKTQLIALHKKYFTWKGKWITIKEYIDKINKCEIKFKLGNHYCWDFLCTCLYSIDNFDHYLPIFRKYDAKKNLFIDKKEIIKENKLSSDKNKNLNQINRDNWTTYKIKRTTNKGNMYIISDKIDIDNTVRILKYLEGNGIYYSKDLLLNSLDLFSVVLLSSSFII